MEIEVKGHSGCTIEIIKENDDLCILKSTDDKKYFSRLVQQANKQQTAYEREYQHIRIPQIYEINEEVDRVSIKMEYVYSKNFIGYFETAGFEQISYFVKAFILFIEKELQVSPLQCIPADVLRQKYLDVQDKIGTNPLLTGDKDIQNIIKQSMRIFSMPNDILIPVGICHGDLTFSNMLFNGNNYYLIDFLDSFVESPLLDIVKLRQDSAYLWSQLMYIYDYDKIRLKIISESIDKRIDTYFSRYTWYREYYTTFQLMNFLRILQYAHEKKVIYYLKDVLKKIINEF